MRLSIITPTIDSAIFLDEAVASVERDAGAEIEHIVVHDGSDEFVEALKARSPWLTILRGPGAGPTAAVRRGIEAATGEFVLWFNSDDKLLPGTIACLAAHARERPQILIWTGGTRIVQYSPGTASTIIRTIIDPSSTALTLANVLDDLPLLTSRFCHRSVFARIGNVDAAFSFSSDREFMVRAALAGIEDTPLRMITTELRMHEGSLTINRRERWVPPYLREHLRLAATWLDRGDIPPQAARLFRNWRAREYLRLIVFQLRAREWRGAAASLGEACASDPLWGLRATTTLAAWLKRRRS